MRERFFVSVIPSSEVAVNPTRQRAPGLLRMALELRMPLEFAASVAALPFLMSGPRGDGHTVLIADRLAQPEGQWKPFERSGALQWLYPDPAAHDWVPDTWLV